MHYYTSFVSPECTADSDCPSTHFCGSALPAYGSNFYDNSGVTISGETVFLQQSEMSFDGQSIISLSTSLTRSISNHITIFATVRQNPGNDGYIVGKGINDRMRDFGLYFRSTKRTVWLAYGSDGVSPGFREILFFYNISIADGNPHSIAAVIDSTVNRAVLYIDGQVAAQRTSLPSIPEFRPEVSIVLTGHTLYVYSLIVEGPSLAMLLRWFKILSSFT